MHLEPQPSNSPQPPLTSRVRVDSSRRVALPASICRAFNIDAGDELTLKCDEHGLHFITIDQAIREFQEYCSSAIVPGRSVVDELIAERREAARHE